MPRDFAAPLRDFPAPARLRGALRRLRGALRDFAARCATPIAQSLPG